uniref:Uncharacterized protein n=1 Tax=Aegilops tauschii subsp. strangulata TaxID=200361 RepID=A0A453GL34_AEGTS
RCNTHTHPAKIVDGEARCCSHAYSCSGAGRPCCLRSISSRYYYIHDFLRCIYTFCCTYMKIYIFIEHKKSAVLTGQLILTGVKKRLIPAITKHLCQESDITY